MPLTKSVPAGDSSEGRPPRTHQVPVGAFSARKPVQMQKDGQDVTLASVAEDSDDTDVDNQQVAAAAPTKPNLPNLSFAPPKAVVDTVVVPEEASATSASGDDAGVSDELDDGEEERKVIKIDLYRPECVKCSHMVLTAVKAYDNCHFSKGNEDCPAALLQLRVSPSKKKIALKLANAQHEGDIEGYSRYMNKLVEACRQGGVTPEEFKKIKRMETKYLSRLEAGKEAVSGSSSKSSRSKRR